MLREKIIKGARRVLPPRLKGAIKRAMGISADTIRDNLFFGRNEISPVVKDDITIDRNWEAIKEEQAEYYVKTDENMAKNPLIYTHRVSFELSNLCNYAKIHKKCPLNLVREPEILPTKITFGILDFLAKYDFVGTIAFHNYNEPLIDPRLFELVRYARRVCLHSDIYICTNGFYLTQTLANELVAAGVSSIHVSGYSRKECVRLSKIQISIPYEVEPMRLDDTLRAYERPESNCKKPCFAPLNEIIIASDASMLLCCLDWRRLYSFGNLHEQTLEEIIKSKEAQAVYQRLSKGDRFLDICKRCDWTR